MLERETEPVDLWWSLVSNPQGAVITLSKAVAQPSPQSNTQYTGRGAEYTSSKMNSATRGSLWAYLDFYFQTNYLWKDIYMCVPGLVHVPLLSCLCVLVCVVFLR